MITRAWICRHNEYRFTTCVDASRLFRDALMFAPPPSVQARIFARIPDRLRFADRASDWAREHRPGLPTDCFIEGPSFDRDGNLFLVDIPFGRIFRMDRDGSVECFVEYDGFPNGLKIHPDGRLFVADRKLGIVTVDPTTREVEVLLACAGETPLTVAFRSISSLARRGRSGPAP